MRTIQAWSLMMLVMATTAFGQTASDLGEGLRAELTGTPGVTAIKWWGKAGRTYFVQSSETLLPDSWQFMPVVEAGTNAVHTWNLQTSAERMFVRLVFTDQAFSGSAADADFDGDGLSNLLETAAVGPRSNPLAADTDDDGFSDSVEWGAGFNPVSGTSNPDASLVNGGIALEFAVVDTWDHVQWRKQTSSPPVTYQTVADYGPGGDYDVSSWQETVPAVPSPRGLVAAESLNFGSWSTEPTTGEDLFFDQPLYAYRVEADMAVVPGPEAPYKGGRNTGTRYAQVRLVTNYPRMQPVTRLVKVLPEKWNAQYGEGFWQGTYAGPEAPQYYALQLPAGSSVGPPVTAQLEVQTGVARTATVALEPTIQITRDIAGGEEKWELVSGRAAKALPGQKINLKLELPPGITASDYHWSSSNWFKDYPEPTHNSGDRVPFESSDLTGQEMQFYWSGTGEKTVTVNCLINGKRVFIHQNFDVVKPNCTLDATQDATVTGPGWPYRGKCSFNAKVDKLPATFSEGGKWMFLQMVSTTLLIVPAAGPPNKCNEFDGEWCLDTRAEWAPTVHCAGTSKVSDGESQAFSDNPQGGANETIGSEQYDDDFRTYVMFKSNEANARWVPLKMVEWDMGYTSTVTGSFGSEEQSYNGSYPQTSRTLTGTETTLHPEWTHITSFLVVPKP